MRSVSFYGLTAAALVALLAPNAYSQSSSRGIPVDAIYTSRCSCDNASTAFESARTRKGYSVGSGVYAGLSTALIVANFARPGHTSLSLAGATVGAAGIGLAASHLSNPNAPSSLAAANAALAAGTVFTAWRSARIARNRVLHIHAERSRVPRTEVSPIMGPSTVGLSVRFR